MEDKVQDYSFWVENFLHLVQTWHVFAVFTAMFVATTVVAVPSAVVPLASGFILVESTSVSYALIEAFLFVALPIAIAATLSSYILFGLVHWGGKPFIRKYGLYIGVREKDVDLIAKRLDKTEEAYIIFVLRLIPIFPLSLVSAAAGFFRVDYRVFGIYTFLGMLPRALLLGMIGWYVKEDFVNIVDHIDTMTTLTVLVALIILTMYIIYLKRNKISKSVLKYV